MKKEFLETLKQKEDYINLLEKQMNEAIANESIISKEVIAKLSFSKANLEATRLRLASPEPNYTEALYFYGRLCSNLAEFVLLCRYEKNVKTLTEEDLSNLKLTV